MDKISKKLGYIVSDIMSQLFLKIQFSSREQLKLIWILIINTKINKFNNVSRKLDYGNKLEITNKKVDNPEERFIAPLINLEATFHLDKDNYSAWQEL